MIHWKNKGVIREVYSPVTGGMIRSHYPDSKEKAIEEQVLKYYVPGDVCPTYGMRHAYSAVFTKTDIRVCCAIEESNRVYAEAVAAGEPTNPELARQAGKPYYWKAGFGRFCGHVGKVTLRGECWECTEGVKVEKVPSPRQIALQRGEKWYPGEKVCPVCRLRSDRHVDNGKCRECEDRRRRAAGLPSVYDPRPGETIAGKLQDIMPDSYRVDRQTAKSLGFKVYRDGSTCKRGHSGWRYVSTGGCLDCKE